VAVIDPSANAVLAQWPTAPATRPHGLAVDAASHRIFSAGANGKLVAIDTGSGAASGSIDITDKVDQIALDVGSGPATRAVWTTYSDGKSSFARGWRAP
jgi:hypothetical protein